MFTLVTDCDNFMKFENRKLNIFIYFNKENNKINNVEVFDEGNQSAFYFTDFNNIYSPNLDNNTLEFIKRVLETEGEI